jgi:asparagine synthase (glutamine-hydrolysing)
MKVLSDILPPGNNKKSLYNYIYRLIFLSSQNNPELFLAAGPDIFEGSLQHFHAWNSESNKKFDQEVSNMLSKVDGGLKQIMALDFDINLFSDLLVKMDIASMANSLEGRSPMLCKELLEFVPGLPDQLKIRGGTTKYLLRKIASGLLPPELINQPKRGFEIPLKAWVNQDLNEIIMDYLHGSNPFFTNFISQQKVKELINRKWPVSEEKRAKMLWSLFCAEVWNKKCFLINQPLTQ